MSRMIILHYTKEKNIWVSYFWGPKSMSAPQGRAQTGFARAAADKIFLIFLQYGAFARCTHHNSSLTANIGAHPHRALTHSHEVLGLFPTPAAQPCARITVSVGLSFFFLFSSPGCTHNPIALKRSAPSVFLPLFSPAPTVQSPNETSSASPAAGFLLHTKNDGPGGPSLLFVFSLPNIAAARWLLRRALWCLVDARCCPRSHQSGRCQPPM